MKNIFIFVWKPKKGEILCFKKLFLIKVFNLTKCSPPFPPPPRKKSFYSLLTIVFAKHDQMRAEPDVSAENACYWNLKVSKVLGYIICKKHFKHPILISIPTKLFFAIHFTNAKQRSGESKQLYRNFEITHCVETHTSEQLYSNLITCTFNAIHSIWLPVHLIWYSCTSLLLWSSHCTTLLMRSYHTFFRSTEHALMFFTYFQDFSKADCYRSVLLLPERKPHCLFSSFISPILWHRVLMQFLDKSRWLIPQ